MDEKLFQTFDLMGKGMLAIFIVIITIMLAVMVMHWLTNIKKDKESE